MATSNPFDFSYLKPQGTATYTLEGVHVPPDNPEPVKLHGKHAGRSNKAYMNALLSEPESREGGARTPEQMDEDDRKLAKRLARTVLTGWSNVPMDFSGDLAERLLLSLIDNERPDAVRGAYIFFSDADRFGANTAAVAEKLGKG